MCVVSLLQDNEMKLPNYKLKKEDVHKLINYATKIPSKAMEVKQEVKKNVTTAILAAFAFIIALVWGDVIKGAVDEVVRIANIAGTGYIYTMISAFFVTIVCVIGIMFFSRWGEKKENRH